MLTKSAVLLTLGLFVAPVAAAAQPVPQVYSVPLPIRQMPNTPGARSDQHGGGITVNGSGQADGPADSARVTLNISSRNNALALNKKTLQPVVDALLRAHVEPSSIVEPIYLEGAASTNYATVGGMIHHPTVAMLQDGMQTLTTAFAAMPDVLVNQAGVGVTMTECTALRTKARRAALAQARRQALEIASASNVQLGKILAVQAFGDGGAAMDPQFPNGCTSYYQIGPGNMPQFMSLADYLKVRINSNVNVTYAIR